MRITRALLIATLAELAAFVREVATSALGLPGRVRFRLLREADRAAEIARRAEVNGNDKNGRNGQ